jgi:hypothetical protein
MKVFFKILFMIIATTETTFAYTATEGNVSAILAPVVYRTDVRNFGQDVNAPNLGGTSLTAIGDINDHGSLELSVMHMHKIYFREREDKYIAEKTQILHITMGYRKWWTGYLSTSLTFFSDYPTGDVDTVNNDFGSNRIETSATEKVIYGFDFAAQYELWSSGRYAIELDTRYSRTVTNRDHEAANHYGYSIGLRYFIQSKKHVDAPPP